LSAVADRLSAALADRYRLERELGAGGMATVYLAEDLKHDRQVAIKVLRPELAAVLGADRFVQEIKTTAALQHPHILPLFAVQILPGPTFTSGAQTRLFSAQAFESDFTSHVYVVLPGDAAFLFVRAVQAQGPQAASSLVMVRNWFQELEHDGAAHRQ